MSLFDRFRRRGKKPASGGPTAKTLAELEEFMSSRRGVEAYAEPPTSIYAMTMVVVAADGEYLRRPVKDDKQARSITRKHGVPLYDARIVGYPRRMRQYDKGVRSAGISLDDLPPLDTIEEDHEE
ncbi:MAG: oxidoreductase [Actinobacteria bacterium]|nr:oxidoreductase [Actinomycetota bacterium]